MEIEAYLPCRIRKTIGDEIERRQKPANDVVLAFECVCDGEKGRDSGKKTDKR